MNSINTYKHLTKLLSEVAMKAGIKPQTPHDFALLSELIQESGAGTLSESTLKRLWGYADGGRRPHKSTLDILGRYISGMAYSQWISSMDSDSGFETASALRIDELTVGSIIVVTWKPDRIMRMLYQGHCEFEVIESTSDRLKPGYHVRVPMLVNGQPMIADVSQGDGEPFHPYVAGRSYGIIWRLD